MAKTKSFVPKEQDIDSIEEALIEVVQHMGYTIETFSTMAVAHYRGGIVRRWDIVINGIVQKRIWISVSKTGEYRICFEMDETVTTKSTVKV